MYGDRGSRCLGIIAAMTALVVIAAVAVTASRTLFSAEAFVDVYLDALERGDVAGALSMPGASGPADSLPVIGPEGASGPAALLVGAARTPFERISVTEVSARSGIHVVEIAWRSAGQTQTTLVRVAEAGARGLIFPGWSFAEPPLSTVTVTAAGDPRVDVADVRLVVPDTATFLVTIPGRYLFGHSSPYLMAAPVAVLADRVDGSARVRVEPAPTALLIHEVTGAAHEFLDACAAQPVLYPTGCPFGREIDEQVVGSPEWTITDQPALSFQARGQAFRAEGDGVASIHVRIRKIIDGSRRWVDDDVAFRLRLDVSISADDDLVVIPDDRLALL